MDWTLIAVVGIVVTGFATVWIYDLRFRHTYTKGYIGLNKAKPSKSEKPQEYYPIKVDVPWTKEFDTPAKPKAKRKRTR